MICVHGTLIYPNHDLEFSPKRGIMVCSHCGQCFSLATLDGLPIYSHAAIRAAGHDPKGMDLDSAIKLLRGRFPCGIPEYRGQPLRCIPHEVWLEAWKDFHQGEKWITAYPADERYMRAIAKLHEWPANKELQESLL